jgi:hypothetical protein
MAEFAGTPAHDVHTLPGILREPLEFHRVGWPSLQSLVDRLDRTGTRYVVVDSTDLQLDPGYFLSRLGEFIRTSIGATGGPRVAPRFHAGSVGTTSGMLYEKVSQTNAIEPPSQSPIPGDRLPVPFREQLGMAYAIYVSLLRNTRRLRVSRESSTPAQPSRLGGGRISCVVDPTFAYCWVSLEEKDRSQESRLVQIRRDRVEFVDYFTEIDKAVVERDRICMSPEWEVTCKAYQLIEDADLLNVNKNVY